MSIWSELRETVGLPRGRARWAALVTVVTLLVAGWVLQERVSAPDTSELEYSALCQLVEQGKVDLVVIKGQEISGDLSEPEPVLGHRSKMFRTLMPANDPAFLALLHDKKVRIRVLPLGPSLLARLLLGALPLLAFLGFGLWFSRQRTDE